MHIRAIFSLTYWDGPLTGIAVIDDFVHAWFSCVDHGGRYELVSEEEYIQMTPKQRDAVIEDHFEGFKVRRGERYYKFYRLSAEAVDEYYRRQAEWERCVGYHNNYFPHYAPYRSSAVTAYKAVTTPIPHGEFIGYVAESEIDFTRHTIIPTKLV